MFDFIFLNGHATLAESEMLDRALSDLFGGFIFIAALLVLSILAISTISAYKKTPTASRRNRIICYSVIDVILSSLIVLFKFNVLLFLLNPYDFFKVGIFSVFTDVSISHAAQATYIISYISLLLITILGFIISLWGFAVSAKEEYKSKIKKPVMPVLNNWMCACGAKNPGNAMYCLKCGKANIPAQVPANTPAPAENKQGQ